jgi:hypothetical protein
MATSTPFVTDPLSVWRSTLNHALRDGKDDTTKVGALRSLTAMSLIGDQRISWPIKYVINNERGNWERYSLTWCPFWLRLLKTHSGGRVSRSFSKPASQSGVFELVV